jgi:ABC-type phosphate transport system substrate-binding protein
MRKKNIIPLLLLASAFFALSSLPTRGRAADETLTFIVNESNPLTEISKTELSDLFLKRSRHWANGTVVRFIDQRDRAPERAVFITDYLKKSNHELELYWIGQKLYTGDSAPLQVSSDNAVISLVQSFPGAIGYVSGDFKGAPGVKKITVDSK